MTVCINYGLQIWFNRLLVSSKKMWKLDPAWKLQGGPVRVQQLQQATWPWNSSLLRQMKWQQMGWNRDSNEENHNTDSHITSSVCGTPFEIQTRNISTPLPLPHTYSHTLRGPPQIDISAPSGDGAAFLLGRPSHAKIASNLHGKGSTYVPQLF